LAQDQYKALHFGEAIRFFRGKLNLPTAQWTDLWEGMHARAFVVAGAMQGELLADFRGAIDKAISEGTTLAEFRKDFDAIVRRHGWSYQGGRGWRTRVIYQTNVRQAYKAGREAQLNDPELRKSRPYGLYKHGDSLNPRPLHLEWDGLVIPLDDPWWDTHTPMNGWGCTCKKFAVGERDLKRLGKSATDRPPDNGTYQWINKQTGERLRLPSGIDPGFAYNVGNAAWGRQISQEAMSAWQAQGAKAWEALTFGGPETYGRPAEIPLDTPRNKLGKRLQTEEETAAYLRSLLGSEEKVFTVADMPVLVNADTLSGHIDPARAEYLPRLVETLDDPFEVWLQFERHKGTGKVTLRMRIIKAFNQGKKKGILMVANAARGMLEGWTFVPASRLKYLENQRRGKLLYGR